VFLGLPIAACLLAGDGHDIALACLSRDMEGKRRLRRLIGEDRVLVKPVLDEALIERVRRLQPELVVSWFWTNRIPMELVDVAPRGGFGVHPSLLPRHRGADPIYWALLLGEPVTGVTAHRLAAEYDTGAILDREELAIDPRWDAMNLSHALDRPSLRLLRKTVKRFASGEPLEEIVQREEEATPAPRPDDDEQWIRWNAPTPVVLQQIRALAPAPGAVTEIGDEIVVVLRGSAVPAPAALETPGESILIDGKPVVRTADGAVRIDLAELDGDVLEDEDWTSVFC
jgi:methionyl-tRNA formyltransferase